MRGKRTAGLVLGATVLGHLLISIIHGRAHTGAAVPLQPAANIFIWVVIVTGPLVGLGLARSHGAVGGWVVAAAMAGSLVFGLVNHFVIDSPDHVAHVAADWRPLFASTAVLLVISEVGGVAAGVWYATRRVELSS